MSNTPDSNEQGEALKCQWCGHLPETSAFPNKPPSTARCMNRACPVSYAGWLSMEIWNRSRASVAAVEEDALVEALAALAHEQWAGWTRYLFKRLKFCPVIIKTIESYMYPAGNDKRKPLMRTYLRTRRKVIAT